MILNLENREQEWIRRFCLTSDFGKEAYIGAAELNCGFIGVNCENLREIEYYSSFHRNMSIRQYSGSIKKRFNIDVIPIYLEPTQFDMDNNQNDYTKEINAVQFCINGIPKIDETHLDWEQVWDFRLDHYGEMRRFYLWSLQEFDGKSCEEVMDRLYIELENYKFMLKKHEILTFIGGFTAILSATGTFLGNIGDGFFSELSAGLSITCGLIIYTVHQTIDYCDMKRSPIAYIYDINKNLL